MVHLSRIRFHYQSEVYSQTVGESWGCPLSETVRERCRSEEEVSRWRVDGEPTGSGDSMVSSCCVGNSQDFTSLYSHSPQVLFVGTVCVTFQSSSSSLLIISPASSPLQELMNSVKGTVFCTVTNFSFGLKPAEVESGSNYLYSSF